MNIKEEKLGPIMTVGHVIHGTATVSAAEIAMRQLLEMKRTDVIVIDENNLDEVRDKLKKGELERGIQFNKLQALTINETIVLERGLPYKKHHKPNTGMKLGSYRYKSK